MTFLPALTIDVFHPLPDNAEPLPGSPGSLRIFKAARLMPVGIGPATPVEAELVWRLLVALRLHGQWAAISGAGLVREILVEQSRPGDQKVDSSSFKVYSRPEPVVNELRNCLISLARYGWIGMTPDASLIWLTPMAIEQSQVPERWDDDVHLLRF